MLNAFDHFTMHTLYGVSTPEFCPVVGPYCGRNFADYSRPL